MSGELTRDAARAASGRPLPEQRRRKAVRALAAVSAEASAQANRDRAAQHLAQVAAAAAARMGYPTLGAFVLARAGAGASLAAISREAGLHKDWLARHLSRVEPAAAAAVRGCGTSPWDARWLPAVTALGFEDVAAGCVLRPARLPRLTCPAPPLRAPGRLAASRAGRPGQPGNTPLAGPPRALRPAPPEP